MSYLNEDYILIHQTCRIVSTWHYLVEFTGLSCVREKSGKILFFQGQGIVREFEKNVREILKGGKCQGNVREFHIRILKICHVMIFIHKITWFSNCELNFLSSSFITLFPVVLVSSKSHQI